MDEFQNFSTESFESILSEARKFRLNLIVANQFMTQLTEKIREGILGNVGTIISGRLGVTDADLMEKAFAPVFNAEDLHKLPNYHAIATVMMYGVPSSPFTMSLLPPMGEGKEEVLKNLKQYSATKYGRARAEVDREINERLAPKPAKKPEMPVSESPTSPQEASEAVLKEKPGSDGFLDKWAQEKAKITATEPKKQDETYIKLR